MSSVRFAVLLGGTAPCMLRSEMERSWVFRELELGAMRTHILHHASRAPVYGSWMLKELKRHGYDLSYGTLYPALHRWKKKGFSPGMTGSRSAGCASTTRPRTQGRAGA